MDKNIAIKTENISKIYSIYNNKNDRLKEALSITRKKYHTDFHALDDVSLEIYKGQTIGIIGKNGSGKSTLLKILTGVLTPTHGNVEINGKVSALLELGTGFNPEMTGMENIYLNGTIMGFTKAQMEKRVQNIVDFADIGEFIWQPVKMYSSGMFARLAFAVAINVEPDILIVDEALSVGDVFFQNKCFRKFEELKRSNITILFVSHDLSSIKQMCENVLWLQDGKKILYEDKEIVCAQYLNAQLLESNNISMIQEGQLSHEIEKYNKKTVFPQLVYDKDGIYSDLVKICSVFITDKNGNIVNSLKVQEEYNIHIVSRQSAEISNAIFGIILENSRGIQVLALNSFINNKEKTYTLRQGNITEAIFAIKLPKFSKGEYLMTVAISRGTQENYEMLTWLNNAVTVTVENTGYNLSLIEFDADVLIRDYDSCSVNIV